MLGLESKTCSIRQGGLIMRGFRLLMVVGVLLMALGFAPGKVQAAPIACDSHLFLAGQFTALADPTPPVLDPHEMHWQFTEGNYQVNYWQTNGIGGLVRRVVVTRNGKTLGVATNGMWSVCHPSNAWKKYLLQRLP